MLKVDWLFGNNYNNKPQGRDTFVDGLGKDSHDSLFSTSLVVTLVESFWERYRIQMILWCFVPFIIYFLSVITYFIKFYSEPIEQEWNGSDENYLRLVTFVLWAYFFFHEIMQIYQKKFDYFRDGWNAVDVLQVALNFWLISNHIYKYIEIEDDTKYGCAAIATLIMWFKLLYWFRLFEVTSLYIRLLSVTLIDISYFMIILVAIICGFANCIYIVNLNRIEVNEDSGIIPLAFVNDGINSIINQYLIALGDYDLDNFFPKDDGTQSPNTALVWILFAVSTFVTQITALNMLVAIMGDTFDKV